MWKRWPFWAGVGGAVAVGTVTAIYLSSGGDAECGAGCIDVRP